MDMVFGHLPRKNVEVYIDDMVVKSPTPTQHSILDRGVLSIESVQFKVESWELRLRGWLRESS